MLDNGIPVNWRPGRFIVRKADEMRVPDFVLKSVGYVASLVDSSELGGDAYDPEGTGFFVGVASKRLRDFHFPYFVTARHVIQGIKFQIGIITNSKLDQRVMIPTYGPWRFHPDDQAADVAVINVTPDSGHDIKYIREGFLRPKHTIGDLDIGIGDEVQFPGLFSYAPGIDKIRPLLRHGSLAMIPEDRVLTESGLMEAYLIEARSLGGLSGSPVFIRRTSSLVWNDGLREEPSVLHGLTGEIHLLGMIHGHWDINEKDLNKAFWEHARQHGVNAGIAVVIPADKILETLYQKDLVEERQAVEDRELGNMVPAVD